MESFAKASIATTWMADFSKSHIAFSDSHAWIPLDIWRIIALTSSKITTYGRLSWSSIRCVLSTWIIITSQLLIAKLPLTSWYWHTWSPKFCNISILALVSLPYKKLGYVFYTFCIRFVYVFKKSTAFIRNWSIFRINYTFLILRFL